MRKGPSIHVALENARVKDQEKYFIYNAVRSGGAKSRKELQNRYDMRPATVTNAVRELLEDKLLVENGSGRTSPGRPEMSLSVNYGRFVAVSCYVDENDLHCALVNLANELLKEVRIPLGRGADNVEFETRLFAAARDVLAASPEGSEPAGIGLAVSGRMDRTRGIWLSSMKHGKIRNLDVSATGKRLGLPSGIKRTIDSMLETELLLDERLCSRNVLLVRWGGGISAAFAHRGRIVGRDAGRFGDIGHIDNRSGSGLKCTCGMRDCIDTKAATWALRPFFERIDASVDASEESVEAFCREHATLEIPEMRAAADEFVMGLQIAHHIFSPDRILIFGPFFADPAVFKKVRALFEKQTGNVRVPMRIVSQCYAGGQKNHFSNCYANCHFSNCYDFFSTALTKKILARY